MCQKYLRDLLGGFGVKAAPKLSYIIVIKGKNLFYFPVAHRMQYSKTAITKQLLK